MSKPYAFTPARAAALQAARDRAAARREAEGTEPQRVGGKRRWERAREAAAPGDGSMRIVSVPRPAPVADPPPPVATAEPVSTPPPAEPTRPTPARDLRRLGGALRRLISSRE